MNLSSKEENYYLNLEKGYTGELKFDQWIEPISNDYLILNDLLLESNNTNFQIDSLVITSHAVYLFEIKNYEGDFIIEGERWYTLPRLEIKNPLFQLQRNETLFRRLLHELGFNSSIESYLIFVNPEFQLYQTPLNSSIIFPSQLNRFLDKMKTRISKLKETQSKLAEQLLSMHLNEKRFFRLPEYDYNKLQKGIICPNCLSFYTTFIKTNLVCSSCGNRENYETAVLRNVAEFNILFPDEKITTNKIHEWCGIIKSRITIWNILSKKFTLVGHGSSSHYIIEEKNI